MPSSALSFCATQNVVVGSWNLPGLLCTSVDASGLVVFAHGSGSSRFSNRNREVARALNRAGIATLLFDLLHPDEESKDERAKVFDISLLSERLADAVQWADATLDKDEVPIGLFGASTGAAAALMVAAELGKRISAVVSRGGRPDLARQALEMVFAPTLLIVGGNDHGVIDLNRDSLGKLKGPSSLVIIPGATHLFPEPGAMGQVIALATGWFERFLTTVPI